MKCSSCGGRLSAGQSFCPTCGVRVEEPPIRTTLTITAEEAAAGCQSFVQLPGMAAALRLNLRPGIQGGTRLKINNARFSDRNGAVAERPVEVTIRVRGGTRGAKRPRSAAGGGIRRRRLWIPIAAALVVLCVALALLTRGGGGSAIVGQWSALYGAPDDFPNSMELFKDGTCIVQGEAGGDYTYEDGRLKLDLGTWYGSYVYACKLDKNELTLSRDGESVTYYRANVSAAEKPPACPYSLPESAVYGDARVVSGRQYKDGGTYYTDFTVERTTEYAYADQVETYTVRCGYYTSAGEWYVDYKESTGQRIDWTGDIVGSWSGSLDGDEGSVEVLSFDGDSIRLAYRLEAGSPYGQSWEGQGTFDLGEPLDESYGVGANQTMIPTYTVRLESGTLDGSETYLELELNPDRLALTEKQPYKYFGMLITLYRD